MAEGGRAGTGLGTIEPPPRSNGRAVSSRFRWLLITGSGDWGRFLVFLLMVVVLGLISPSFFTLASWLATSQYATEVMFLALGEAFVIISGGIDLSVGAILGFSSMLAGLVMAEMVSAGDGSTITIVTGYAVGMASGAGLGWINGIVIAKWNMPPFIVTLGMLGVATGGTNLLHGGVEIVNLPMQLSTIGNEAFGGWLTIPVLVAAMCIVLTHLLLSRTRFGLRTFAIGCNPQAARRAGINLDRHIVWIYTLSGLLAGISGILVMSRFVDASPLAGANDNLNAIACVVIGGASLAGGRGSVPGSVIGMGIIAILETGLILANVPPFWQTVAVGLIIVAAVRINQLRDRYREVE